MPFHGHSGAIGFAIVSRCVAVFHNEPGKHLAKNRVRVFHQDLFVQLFEGNGDEVKESINEGGVHVYDVVVLLECHAVGDFDIGTIVGVSAHTASGNICNFRGERIVCISVCLTT
jgi:hypothetical protein